MNVGDKVFVDGKKAGVPGKVVAILNQMPTGPAAFYTLNVLKAFNIVTVES